MTEEPPQVAPSLIAHYPILPLEYQSLPMEKTVHHWVHSSSLLLNILPASDQYCYPLLQFPMGQSPMMPSVQATEKVSHATFSLNSHDKFSFLTSYQTSQFCNQLHPLRLILPPSFAQLPHFL